MKRKSLIFLVLLLIVPLFLFAGGDQEKEAEGPKEVTITIWTKAGETELWRGLAAVEAAKELNKELESEGIVLTVEAVQETAGWGDFNKKFTMASEAGKGPDILCTGHENIAVYGSTGYIIPLADSVEEIKAMAPEFDDVIEGLWDMTSWRGQIWGIPQDTEARPMFFSKTKLNELGWSDAKIAALPDEIAKGNFTLDDMIETGKEAIAKGVVEPGYGYWSRPKSGGDFIQYYMAYGGQIYDAEQDKLVIVKDALLEWYKFQRRIVTEGVTPKNFLGTDWGIWHNTVSHNNALFFAGGVWHFAEWATQHVQDIGGMDYLFENFGYALQPTGIRGVAAQQMSHPLIYVVVAEDSSGNSNQDLAIRLLQKMTTKELNTNHAVGSGHLGILKSQAEYTPYKEDRLLSETLYMLDYAFFQPNHPYYPSYWSALWTNMEAVQNAALTPEEGVAAVLEVLEVEIGDALIIK
ncbi:MAG: twin-arginine translocation pathway signal protein [Spirochaetales bacterium]|nr:twin-arginine translocation pathway signal protein [Spirochaetales bacterium]